MWAEQPPNDQIPLFDGLKEYVGLLNQFHDAISSCRAASQKVSEIEVVRAVTSLYSRQMSCINHTSLVSTHTRPDRVSPRPPRKTRRRSLLRGGILSTLSLCAKLVLVHANHTDHSWNFTDASL